MVSEFELLKPCDMPDSLQDLIVHLAENAAKDYDVDHQGAQAAEYIKKSLDEKADPHWHVIIGNNFGCYAIHEKQRFMYFKLRGRCYMVYKAGRGPNPVYVKGN
jgi:dynein light chain LC8-type